MEKTALESLAPIITFLPYQKDWLGDRSRFKIGMFARQTGKTFSTCAEIVDDCITAEIEGRRVRWVILSRGERQAKEAMDEAIKPFCKSFYEIYNTRPLHNSRRVILLMMSRHSESQNWRNSDSFISEVVRFISVL